MATKRSVDYLSNRIRSLSESLNSIKRLKEEVTPDELHQKVVETELLLRGYIHQLEEKLNELL